MWQAWDLYQRTDRAKTVNVEFWTGMPTMFSVPKYSEALNALRMQRDIPGQFGHNLVSIDSANRKATFKKADGTDVIEEYMLLHVTPPQGPADYIKSSPLADGVGWVDVDPGTLQHKKCTGVICLNVMINSNMFCRPQCIFLGRRIKSTHLQNCRCYYGTSACPRS